MCYHCDGYLARTLTYNCLCSCRTVEHFELSYCIVKSLFPVTKEILRCNVIVGEISILEIETTTRLLYLEDSPEELIARGYDSEGW